MIARGALSGLGELDTLLHFKGRELVDAAVRSRGSSRSRTNNPNWGTRSRVRNGILRFAVRREKLVAALERAGVQAPASPATHSSLRRTFWPRTLARTLEVPGPAEKFPPAPNGAVGSDGATLA